jgi:transcription termination factor Rho
MSVLDRSALAESSLADLHEIASELGIDGFRRLRREPLIDAILARQGGPEAETAEPVDVPDDLEGELAQAGNDDAPRRPRSRRGGRGRGGGGRAAATAGAEPADSAAEPETAEGTVELLGNGSAFLRLSPPDPSDGDVYVSAAQVRRCELVSGDVVSGPVRPPRRSERYPSLVRVETINGEAADSVAQGTRYEDLPSSFPAQRLVLEGDDPTLRAIDEAAPLGRGSRALIVGPSRAGKTEALRRVAGAMAGIEGVDVTLVLAGVRPEEVSEWRASNTEPQAALDFGASAEAQGQAVERAVDAAKRIAARGGDAVVLVDTLEHLHPPAARRILSAARNLSEAGSLTVIATATRPFGGETTVITLDGERAKAGDWPAIDPQASGTMRADALG